MKNYFSTILFLSYSILGISQQDGNIETHEITIVKDYNVFIEEGEKQRTIIDYKPQFQDKNSQKKLTYSLPDRIEEFKFETSSIEPIPFKSTLHLFKNKSYIKLGLGSLLNPVLEWNHNTAYKVSPLNFKLNHHSTWKNPDTMQQYSQSNFQLEFKKSLKSAILVPKLQLGHKLINFYGNLNESIDQKRSTRNFGFIQAEIEHKKESSESKKLNFQNIISANLGIDGLKLLDTTQTNNEIQASGQSNLSYKLSENVNLGLGLGFLYNSYKYDTFYDKWIMNLFPKAVYKTKVLKIQAGLNISNAMINSNQELFILPSFESDLQLIPHYVNFYSKWERTLDVNSMISKLNLNPFIRYHPSLLPNSKIENRSLGLKGAFKDLAYHGFFTQKIIKDAILFSNDSLNPRYLNTEIEKNFTQNNLGLELSFQKKQSSAFVKAELFLYELDNLKLAFNLPNQKLSVGFNTILFKKLQISSNIYSIGSIKSIILGQERNQKPQIDMNLASEFGISQNFYIFANINNILNTQSAQFIGYRLNGFNAQGGFRLVY